MSEPQIQHDARTRSSQRSLGRHNQLPLSKKVISGWKNQTYAKSGAIFAPILGFGGGSHGPGGPSGGYGGPPPDAGYY